MIGGPGCQIIPPGGMMGVGSGSRSRFGPRFGSGFCLKSGSGSGFGSDPNHLTRILTWWDDLVSIIPHKWKHHPSFHLMGQSVRIMNDEQWLDDACRIMNDGSMIEDGWMNSRWIADGKSMDALMIDNESVMNDGW